MAVGDENTVTHYSGCALVAVGECLNVAEQNKRKKSFLEDIALAINESHSIFKCLSDLGFIVKGECRLFRLYRHGDVLCFFQRLILL